MKIFTISITLHSLQLKFTLLFNAIAFLCSIVYVWNCSRISIYVKTINFSYTQRKGDLWSTLECIPKVGGPIFTGFDKATPIPLLLILPSMQLSLTADANTDPYTVFSLVTITVNILV